MMEAIIPAEQRHITAVHEAGHAVVAGVLGARVDYIACNLCNFSWPHFNNPEASRIRNDILVAVAGLAAEALAESADIAEALDGTDFKLNLELEEAAWTSADEGTVPDAVHAWECIQKLRKTMRAQQRLYQQAIAETITILSEHWREVEEIAGRWLASPTGFVADPCHQISQPDSPGT